ncbi:MAG TPA: right-handed parallel beta-helix repeat-containing protein [Capillimicrobium sp.]|nr:right-handed parallel beta-helix repeat-containing protein [Capillimicrobium sp.]
MRTRTAVTLAVAGALLAAAPAQAQSNDYPEPSNPGKVQKPPKGKKRTLHVCKRGCDFTSINAAVKQAKAGWTVKVGNGTYREGVQISGAGKRYLKLIGNVKHPEKVVLEGKGLKGIQAQNGVQVNGADQVTVRGFTAQHYKGNGFFVINANGYELANLRAFRVGVYGIYAFNTIGGVMRDSEAAWNNDAGFYIGQTPPQDKPKRSLVTNVRSYGNVLGFSGTNMRYVTITKSQWFNNGSGIVPNALTSEKYPPEEDNVITDNDIFWNNFNYYKGAPFPLREAADEATPYPIGVGVLLFGGRRNVVEGNRIYGNYLVGVGALQQLLLKDESARDLIGNEVRDNEFGLNGTDLNGRDLFYDGNGRDNCFGPNQGVQTTFPEDGSTMTPCPFSGANAFSSAAQSEAVNWALDPTHEAHWIKHPHAPKPGYTPLEDYAGYTGPKAP